MPKLKFSVPRAACQWLPITFASGMIIPLVLLPKLMSRAPSVTFMGVIWYSVLTSAIDYYSPWKDVGFFFGARQKLYSEFRKTAIGVAAPIRLPFAQSPPLPEAPPVIGASSS